MTQIRAIVSWMFSPSTPWRIRLRLFAAPRWSWPSTRLRPCKRLVGHNWSSIAEMGTLDWKCWCWMVPSVLPLSVSYCCLLIQTRSTIPPFCLTNFNVGHGKIMWNKLNRYEQIEQVSLKVSRAPPSQLYTENSDKEKDVVIHTRKN